MLSRDRSHVVSTVLALLVALGTSRAAWAEPQPAPRLTAMPVTDGPVNAAVQLVDTLYIGGSFKRVGVSSGRFVTVAATTGVAEAMVDRYDEGQANIAIPDGAGGWYVGGQNIVMGAAFLVELVHVLPDGSADPGFTAPDISGEVRDVVLHNGVLYIAGNIIKVNDVDRHGLAALDATTGALQTFDPNLNGAVNALEKVGTTLYAGGNFTDVNGTSRSGIAAFDLTTHTLTAWNPGITGYVLALQMVGTTMYVGGQFTAAGGASRSNLAALDTTVDTNNATAWDPQSNGRVLTFGLAGNMLLVGGEFILVNSVNRFHLAAYNVMTGLLLPWAPNPTHFVRAIVPAANGTTVYIGGQFEQISGMYHPFAAEIDLASASLMAWNPAPTASVYTIAVDGSRVGIGGVFSGIAAVPRLGLAAIHMPSFQLTSWAGFIGDGEVRAMTAVNGVIYIGGTFTEVGGTPRLGLAAIDTAGSLQTWNPGADGPVHALAGTSTRIFIGGAFANAGGVSAANLIAVDPITDAPVAPSLDTSGPVRTLRILSGRLFVGGEFTTLAGAARANVGSLNAATAIVDAGWAPATDGPVYAIDASPTRIYIGGEFSQLNGSAHVNLGAVGWADAAVDNEFTPTFDGAVHAIRTTYGAVLVGGSFLHVNGISRSGAVSLRPDSGLLRWWSAGMSVDEDNHPTSFITTPSGVWMVGSFYFVRLTVLPGVAFFPDETPTLQPLSDVTVPEDQALNNVPLVAGDDVLPSGWWHFVATSSNQAIVAADGIALTHANGAWTLDVTPVANAVGTTTISVTVDDGMLFTTRTFQFTTTSVTDPPIISGLINATIGKNTVYTRAFSVTDADSSPNMINLSVTSTNQTLVPNGNITISGALEDKMLTVTPAADLTGTAIIQVMASDGISQTQANFTLTVATDPPPQELPPGPPQNLQSAVNNQQVTLTWQAPISGGAPTGYILEGGTTPGGSDLPTMSLGLVTSHVATYPAGTYYLRVRATNAQGMSAPSNEVTVVISNGLPTVPGAPSGLISGVASNLVILYWVAPITGGAPTHYVLEAGSASGQADLATLPLMSMATGVQIPAVPVGTYYLRVRAANAIGVGPASNDVVVTVGSPGPCASAPNAPILLTPTVQGSLVTLSWMPSSGSATTGYRVRVGSTPDAVDIAEIPINSTLTSLMAAAPPGIYYVRLIGMNDCGSSTPSNEVSLTVQGGVAPPGPVTGLMWTLGPNRTVTLQWQSTANDVTSYVVVAGSTTGAADLAVVPTGSTSTTLSVSGVSAGTYYVRVHAINGGGQGPGSNEIVIVVP